MKHALIAALIEKKAFVEDTIITAHYQTVDLFGRVFDKIGDFKVSKILAKSDEVIFELRTLDNPKGKINAEVSAIKAIDGMDIIRYADIYDIQPDGSIRRTSRKRGRKPKIELSA